MYGENAAVVNVVDFTHRANCVPPTGESMIQNMLEKFLAEHCGHLSAATAQSLTTMLASYVSRNTSSKVLMDYAKSLDLIDQVRELRRHFDGNPYSSSRLWRAVWLRLNGTRTQAAASTYKVAVDDVDWALGNMSSRQIRVLSERADNEWIRHPDYEGIVNEILSTLPYCRKFVNQLSFVIKYDPAFTLKDLEREMFNAGLSAAFRSDHRTTDLVHLRNIAWKSATNCANSIIKHETTQGRQRCVRIRSEARESVVNIFRRTSQENPNAGPSTEDIEDFLKGFTAPTDVQKFQLSKSVFTSTTTYLETPVGKDGNTSTLGDIIEDGNARCRIMAPGTAELVHDLAKQPESIQKICAVILGDEDPCFDQWLQEHYGKRAGQLKDKKIVTEACKFYGISRQDLQAAVGPMLGVIAAK